MIGYKARTLLAKTAGLNFLISVGLVAWHILDGKDPDGTLIALFLVLFIGGALIAAIRHGDGQPIESLIDRFVDKVVAAFIASRPAGADPEPLRLVGPPGNGSTTPAPRRSVL